MWTAESRASTLCDTPYRGATTARNVAIVAPNDTEIIASGKINIEKKDRWYVIKVDDLKDLKAHQSARVVGDDVIIIGEYTIKFTGDTVYFDPSHGGQRHSVDGMQMYRSDGQQEGEGEMWIGCREIAMHDGTTTIRCGGITNLSYKKSSIPDGYRRPGSKVVRLGVDDGDLGGRLSE